MFMGTTYNSIDDKKRMIVPAKMRSSLDVYKRQDLKDWLKEQTAPI